MGVAGTGKTSVGRRLAAELGWAFLDADELHSEASRRKMAAGTALDDTDRLPWLRRVRAAVDQEIARGASVVVACSALRERYRRVLLDGAVPAAHRFVVHLHGDADLIDRRLRERPGHFFAPSLLPSQLATLEAPPDALAIDVAVPIEDVVERILVVLDAGR